MLMKNRPYKIILQNSLMRQEGFTIVELMVALLMLLIILFAFTPLIVGSFERIIYAGDKSEALYQSQAEIEANISYKETIDGFEVEFSFGENVDKTTINVPGGFIDSPQSKGDALAWLSTFVPYVPSIILSDPFLSEGYNGDDGTDYLQVYVMGTDTKLSDADHIYIYKRNDYVTGNTYNYSDSLVFLTTKPTNVSAGYDEYAQFRLPVKSVGLTNAESPYVVMTNWKVGDLSVYVRARLHIMLPDAVAVGSNGEIVVSPDADVIWNVRNNEISITSDINDVLWANFRFIAITSDGKALIWGNQQEPYIVDTPVSVSLNSLAFGDNKLVAVGNGGAIVTSDNGGQTWTLANSGTDKDLLSVTHNGSEFMAVGKNGNYLRSTDAATWTLHVLPAGAGWQNLSLLGVSYGSGAWIVVGERRPSTDSSVLKAVIHRIPDAPELIPQEVFSSVPNHTWLNDVAYGSNVFIADEESVSMFVAVGESGRIMTSTDDGMTWTLSTVGSTELKSVTWDGFHDIQQFIIVGNSGKVITGVPKAGDSSPWIERTSGSTKTLKGVTVRWEN